MNKMIALFLAILMLFALCAAEAETAGKIPDVIGMTIDEVSLALQDKIELTVYSNSVYAFLLNLDGRYFRATAIPDETTAKLYDSMTKIDSKEAFNAYTEAAGKLVISKFEEITEQPLSSGELAAFTGKTLAELEDEGWSITEIEVPVTENKAGYEGLTVRHPVKNFEYDCPLMYLGTVEKDEVIYVLDNGLYLYEFVADMPCGEFLEHVRNTNNIWDVKLTPVRHTGLSSKIAFLDLNPDGTVRDSSGK